MSEFSEALKQKYTKPRNTEIVDRMNKQRVKGTILAQCEKHLQEVGDRFTFESLKGELQYVVEAINEEPLKSRYVITQVSETLFEASLVEVDLGF